MPEREPPRTLLNVAQRSHVEVALAALERRLADIEAMIAGTSPSGRLTRVAPDLPRVFTARAPDVIAGLRAEIAHLATSLGLEVARPRASRAVQAALMAQLVHLDDCVSQRLQRFGPVDPALTPRLDPAIERLQTGIDALLGLLPGEEPGAG